MDFDLNTDQKEIQRTAKDLLAKRATPDVVRKSAESRTYDDALTAELAGLGWPGIAVAEEHGGQGLGIVELSVLLEELGSALAPTPFLPTAATAIAIEHAGTDDQRSRWLPGLASGEITAAIGRPDLLLGSAAPDLHVIIDNGALWLREGAPEQAIDTIDPTRRAYRLPEDVAGEPMEGDVEGALARIAIAAAAELTGVSQRALDMTLAYVKDRKQFDTPVGAFQAVAHRCAQMLLHTESARSATYYAAWTADAAEDRLPEGAPMAAAAAIEAGREVTASAIQAHGGIGFTWEADVHWLYKRAQVAGQWLGGVRPHRRRIAALLAARAGVAS